MNKNEIHFQTLTSLAKAIREENLSPVALTEHFLDRIDALDGDLNAFRLVCRERAMGQARAAEMALKSGCDLGPLHGIPYAVKDLFDVRNLPTTAGTGLMAQNIAREDAAVVRRLQQAGMVLLGKTNTVQFAYSGVGINNDHGTPRNPWRRTHHVPGGSSSGSGVSVAAGMTPMALGTDTGGSVRIPASLCGTVGLKTTVGRISRTGVYPLSWSLDSVGVLSRSVEDAALIYQCLHGPDLSDETTSAVLPHDVLKPLKDGVRGLRLAFAEAVFWEDVHPDVERAVRACGPVFESLGARVDRIPFPEAEEAVALNPKGLIVAAEAYTVNRNWLDSHFDRLDPVVAHRMIKGKEIRATEYIQISRKRVRLRARVEHALREVDALLVPATPIPAVPFADVNKDMDAYSRINLRYLCNTSIGNTLNLCALVAPCGFTKEGLPIGLMIYGKPFQEDVVLQVGYAFEQATDWRMRRPALDPAA